MIDENYSIIPDRDIPQNSHRLLERIIRKSDTAWIKYLNRIAKEERSRIKDTLKKEDVGKPLHIVTEVVRKNNGASILVVGESSHHGSGVLDFENKLIEELHNDGIKLDKIYLEEDVGMSSHLGEFYRSGIMSEELQLYLSEGFVRVDSEPHNFKVDLLLKCRELGIPVEFIDENRHKDRDGDWYNKICAGIGDTVNGNYLLICGETHASKTKISTRINNHPRPTVTSLLVEKYGDKVISVLATNKERKVGRGGEIVAKKFNDDLNSLGIKEDAGLLLSTSPYKGRLSSAGNFVIASDSYDVLLSLNGVDLAK